jgi:nitrogen-specific signal transduction histidine kinase/tetratricopeptide (TPR) repeat protein
MSVFTLAIISSQHELDVTSSQAQLQETLEREADIALGLVNQVLGTWNGRLESLLLSSQDKLVGVLIRSIPDSVISTAVLVVCGEDWTTWYPERCLILPPAIPDTTTRIQRILREGEQLEFYHQDLSAALAYYLPQTEDQDPGIRIEARLRAARVRYKLGDTERALEMYRTLLVSKEQLASGLPAGLAARIRIGQILVELGRHAEAAPVLEASLRSLPEHASRLTWDAYHFVAESFQALARSIDADILENGTNAEEYLPEEMQSLYRQAGAVHWLWDRWRSSILTTSSSHPSMDSYGDPVAETLLLWRPSANRLALFSGDRRMLLNEMFHEAAGHADQANMDLSLEDESGQLIWGSPPTDRGFSQTRDPAQTGIPWRLCVGIRDPAEFYSHYAVQQRLLLVGLFSVIVLVCVAGFSLTRAIRHELFVARLKADFVANVSHELRTPLTAIRQMSEMLAEGRVQDEERSREYHLVLDRESTRLQQIVEELLDFRRLEKNAQEFDLRPIDLVDLVQNVVNLFQSQADSSYRNVILKINRPEVAINADRAALGRAVWNLLDNACKYGRSNRPIEVSVLASSDSAHVSVRDYGIGIPEKEQAKIFDSFVRGESARKESIRGTGLGLAIVRHIVHAHHGRVELFSQVGSGSEFRLILPLRR